MISKGKSTIIYLIFTFLFLYSCKSGKTIEIESPHTLIGLQSGEIKKQIYLDYTHAIDSGFIIPTKNQTVSGFFKTEFNIVNNGNETKLMHYKIFYQNESYAFSESINDTGYNPLSSENFYGSWEELNDSVKTVKVEAGKSVLVTDSLRIVGNPRNEEIFFGTPEVGEIEENEIQEISTYIKKDTNWFKSIVEKAKTEKRSVEEQLRLDAIYTINEKNKNRKINIRSRRNPRVGEYKLYLLVYEDNAKPFIPSEVIHINKSGNTGYVNPLYFIKNSIKKPLEGVIALQFNESLVVKSTPDLGNGIYIDKKEFIEEKVSSQFFNKQCNNSNILRKNAAFKQYIHRLPENFYSPNIPVIADIQSDKVSIDDYLNYQKSYSKDQLIPSSNVITQCACETVHSDSTSNTITLTNPGVRRNLKVKENVGIMSRHGLTYGKYTFKVKMPELLNKNNIWNGLTNAIWMINERSEEWNNRRKCEGNGYIPKSTAGTEDAERKNILAYSEIDFEIRKANPYWPTTSYSKEITRPPYKEEYDNKIIVTYTNWDLACNQPPLFNAGVRSIKHNDQEFLVHRWTHWYQAITGKQQENDDVIFGGDYYYFQIEWRPESISWRLGPSKEKLKEVGYMNDQITSIPNNQMLCVITQEYHISEWWPESPQLQEYIPIPLKDINGRILSIEIE